jgi:hypothetical protein
MDRDSAALQAPSMIQVANSAGCWPSGDNRRSETQLKAAVRGGRRAFPDQGKDDEMTRRITRCTFEGCPKTSEQPRLDGWGYLLDWGPGVPDGFYCREHREAIEAIHWDILEEQERAGRNANTKP